MADRSPQLRYHCVSVAAGLHACSAAKSVAGMRMLSTAAPRLPLADCDSPATCRCTYHHHDDRRAGSRRAAERGELADPWAYTNRRRSGGRRATD
jgi:hypothetical protein